MKPAIADHSDLRRNSSHSVEINPSPSRPRVVPVMMADMSDEKPNAWNCNLFLIVIGLMGTGLAILLISDQSYGATRQAIAAPGGVLFGLAILIIGQMVVRGIFNSSRRK